MKDCTNEELGRLTSKLLDGVIGDGEHKRLTDLLSDSSSNRKEYLEFIRIESLLHWESEDITSPDILDSSPKKTVIYSFPFWLGTAAAVFLAMSAIWWSQKPSNHDEAFAVNQPTATGTIFSPSNHSFEPNGEQIADRPNLSILPKLNLPFSGNKDIESKALAAIENVLNTNESISKGVVEYHGAVKRWSLIHNLLTPAENGILPASGSTMIGLDKMTLSIESQTAEVAETVQVLDIRKAIKDSSKNEAKVFAAVKFNQSFGDSQEGAEFGITLQAFKKEGDSIPQELLRAEQRLISDRDPSTWDGLTSELVIPDDAQFLVVSLSARKQGPDSVLANTSSYYADDLQLYLSFDEQLTIGPI